MTALGKELNVNRKTAKKTFNIFRTSIFIETTTPQKSR